METGSVERVLKILACQGIEHFSTMDSLDMVEFLLGVEREFDLSISDEDAGEWHSLHDVAAYVDARLTPA
jgi:acyl carrier protein